MGNEGNGISPDIEGLILQKSPFPRAGSRVIKCGNSYSHTVFRNKKKFNEIIIGLQ
jgi:hypothetical protein